VKLKRSPGTPALAAPYQPNTSKRDLHIGTEFETAEPESYEFAGESHPIAATREQNRCPHSGSRCNTSFTWRDRLAKPLLVSHHFRTRPAACTAAATALTDDSFDLGSLPIAEVLPNHNPEVVLFQHPP
jgi:hypothetical protein